MNCCPTTVLDSEAAHSSNAPRVNIMLTANVHTNRMENFWMPAGSCPSKVPM